jgi:hypothetical protein
VEPGSEVREMRRPLQKAITFEGRERREGKSKFRFLTTTEQFQMPLALQNWQRNAEETVLDKPAFLGVGGRKARPGHERPVAQNGPPMKPTGPGETSN